MQNRPVRYRGKEYPVIERFRLGGRTYLAVKRLSSAERRAYQAFDTASKQMRALHELPDTPATVQRIRTLQHLTWGSNEMLQIHDYHRDGGRVWVVLNWVDGFDLRDVLTGIRELGKPRIAAPEAVRLFKGLAHALYRLHKKEQIVHGDIKPANLILMKRGGLVLIDYGSAWTIERTATREEGDGVSSVYAAPEQLRGKGTVGFRADIFSVGVVLYEVLTDRIPYDGYGGKVGLLPDSARSGLTLVPVSQCSPERNRISARIWTPIDHLIQQSLAIDASDRFPTTSAWLDAWQASMKAIRDTPRHAKPGFVVRMSDWIARRFQ